MYKYLLIFISLVVINTANAQDETVNTTTENKTDDEMVELKKKLNKSKDRLVLDFTYDMLLNLPDSIQTKGFSRGFNVYFTYDVVLGKSRFSIAPGVGIGTNNYFFKGHSISSDTLGTYFNKISSDITVKKSKIALTYVDIPVELRYRSKLNSKGNSWKLAAGFKAGLMIQNKWKYKGESFDNDGQETKFKEYDIENVNKFRYGVMLRGGYGIWNVFAYYQLSDVFNDKGPRMTPLSIGLSINAF